MSKRNVTLGGSGEEMREEITEHEKRDALFGWNFVCPNYTVIAVNPPKVSCEQ